MAIRVGGGEGYTRRRPRESAYGKMDPTQFDIGKGHNVPLLNPEFSIGIFDIQEERDDYLLCKGYDPNSYHAHRESIKVAKPTLLQKTRWDGQTVTLGDVDVTFEYTGGVGRRIARGTIDGEEVEEVQRITMDYFAEDTIVAVEIKKSPVLNGVDVDTEDGGRLRWIDLNVSGRCWAVALDEEAE